MDGRTHREFVAIFWGSRLIEFVSRLAAHAVVRSRQIADGSVACAIREKRRREGDVKSCFDMACDDGFDAASVHVDGADMVVREEGDVAFGGDERRLLFIFVL